MIQRTRRPDADSMRITGAREAGNSLSVAQVYDRSVTSCRNLQLPLQQRQELIDVGYRMRGIEHYTKPALAYGHGGKLHRVDVYTLFAQRLGDAIAFAFAAD